MYESYWNLTRKPFAQVCDPASFYPSDSHQAALVKLRYAIENSRGSALLAGPPGHGKTMLARTLVAQLPDWISPRASLVFPRMNPQELLTSIAVELGAVSATSMGRGVAENVIAVQRFLTENASQGKHALLSIDEAHLLDGAQAFETLRLLLNFESPEGPALSLLLIGQSSLWTSVDRLAHFEERLAARAVVKPLSPEETMSYVQYRLKVAGASQPIFTDAALEAIHRASRGVPRHINRVCDLALLVGFAEELDSIGPDRVESVTEELVGAGQD